MPELNFPGPYELRMIYTTNIASVTFTHVARYNVDCDPTPSPGDDPSTVLLKRRGTTPATIPMDDFVDAWVTVIKPLWSNAGSISYVELWKFEEESFNGDFVTVYDVGVVGSGGVGPTPAAQLIHTYRTVEGGVLKLNFMEAGITFGASTNLGTATGTNATIRDFVLGDDNVFLGRDTSMPFAAKGLHPGQNEALFKKRYRQT